MAVMRRVERPAENADAQAIGVQAAAD